MYITWNQGLHIDGMRTCPPRNTAISANSYRLLVLADSADVHWYSESFCPAEVGITIWVPTTLTPFPPLPFTKRFGVRCCWLFLNKNVLPQCRISPLFEHTLISINTHTRDPLVRCVSILVILFRHQIVSLHSPSTTMRFFYNIHQREMVNSAAIEDFIFFLQSVSRNDLAFLETP